MSRRIFSRVFKCHGGGCSAALFGLSLVAAAFHFGAALPAAAETVGDLFAGRDKARFCDSCHGMDGVATIAEAPNIGGESIPYLTRQMEAYRRGDRTHVTMVRMSQTLSDQDIADLAVWYGSLRPRTRVPIGHTFMSPVLCTICHSADGRGLTPDAPNIAGESATYIMRQLNAYRNGERQHAIMNSLTADMTEYQMLQAAQWYARIRFWTAPPEIDVLQETQ